MSLLGTSKGGALFCAIAVEMLLVCSLHTSSHPGTQLRVSSSTMVKEYERPMSSNASAGPPPQTTHTQLLPGNSSHFLLEARKGRVRWCSVSRASLLPGYRDSSGLWTQKLHPRESWSPWLN